MQCGGRRSAQFRPPIEKAFSCDEIEREGHRHADVREKNEEPSPFHAHPDPPCIEDDPDHEHRPGDRHVERQKCGRRSEEHTSELQSLMRISYAVFCLKKKNTKQITTNQTTNIQRTD